MTALLAPDAPLFGRHDTPGRHDYYAGDGVALPGVWPHGCFSADRCELVGGSCYCGKRRTA